jgi:hypothetical protein
VSEVVGLRSTGRTSLLQALLAAATAAHEVTAVVDLPNAFDPASAERAAVDLDDVLWVRPPSLHEGLRCTELILGAGGFALVILDLDDVSLQSLRRHSWPRLARAAERSGTALVVLAAQRVAGSFAALSVVMTRRAVCWAGLRPVLSRVEGPAPTFEGLDSHSQLARNKLGPPGVVTRLRWVTTRPLPSPPPLPEEGNRGGEPIATLFKSLPREHLLRTGQGSGGGA